MQSTIAKVGLEPTDRTVRVKGGGGGNDYYCKPHVLAEKSEEKTYVGQHEKNVKTRPAGLVHQ